MKSVKAKKHLGQHFLTDLTIARKIVDSLDAVTNPVIEIGPGMGVLTQFLIQRKELTPYLIEIDTESVRYLKVHYPELDERILEKDFLKAPLEEIIPEPFSIIGNFPYNISSQIFFKVLENKDTIPQVVGMLQKEVAERIASPPGNKTYGILSVFLQAYYDIEYLFTVDEDVFDPPPKVKSAVIKLVRNKVAHLQCNEKLFFNVVKTAFNQRRKTLSNSLKPIPFNREAIIHLPLLRKRPEQLSVKEFEELTQLIESNPII